MILNMRSITKVFFLSALFAFALVALAPNGARAATTDVSYFNLSVSPSNTVSVPNSGGSLTITGQAFKVDGTKATIDNPTHITSEIVVPIFGTLSSAVLDSNDTSKFALLYTFPAMTVVNPPVTLKVTINSKVQQSIITFVLVTQKKAGEPCDPDATTTKCILGTACERDTGGICIPIVENRKIGTYCTEADHCARTQTLTLTCDKSQNACVGATNNVSCADSVVNTNSDFGKIATELSSEQRCDTGLVCDAEALKCVNDFGQAEVPGDKLGEAATDLRDQIRELINIALGFLGVIGVIVTLYGGFTWMTAFGDEEKVGKAKKTLVAGMIGIFIIGVAWTIVSYVLKVTESVA